MSERLSSETEIELLKRDVKALTEMVVKLETAVTLLVSAMEQVKGGARMAMGIAAVLGAGAGFVIKWMVK